jgi:hypothetical protein
MTTLRCTAKLRKRLRTPIVEDPPPPANLLGDWFANIIFTPRSNYVLLVSERSLLPVITTARDLRKLELRFTTELGDVLLAIGVRRELIARELSLMEPILYGRTNDRRVLGSMNDLIFNFKDMMARGRSETLLGWSLELARTPCGPIGMSRPRNVARRLLENPHGFRVIDGGPA